MIDVVGPPAPFNAPSQERDDAPILQRGEAPAADVGPQNGRIATPPPGREGGNGQVSRSMADTAGVDGDSEAETLIESPEKRKLNMLENPPRLHPAIELSREGGGDSEVLSSLSSESGTRKRKRSDDGSKDESLRPSSRRSSPLSSPIPDVQSGTESGTSHSHRHPSLKGPGEVKGRDEAGKESKEAEGKHRVGRPSGNGLKSQKRKERETEDSRSHPARRRLSQEAGNSERRETRSATYPRQESIERSISPRPGRDHKRITSVQSVQTLASHKARRIPAPLNTKRNRSSDRSSDASNSPAPSRPQLQKFASNDYDATSPAKVMAKKLRDRHGRTLLAQACTDDKLERVKQVYDERPQDLNIADNAGNTPLQIAALQGHVEIVEFLLDKHCEVNTRNIEKDTPLIDAVENGHIEVVKLLLEHGADPKLGNAQGEKPIELVDEHDDKIRRLLVDAKNRSLNRRQSEDQAPVGHAREGSSRAASAASPRDSPPIHGPKSPPLQLSRRRAREQTRNDLLWQANTPENLTKLAGKGDTEGVVNILNILTKASPEALIAACKGGHDVVLQLLIAMGNPDPDPDPIVSPDQRRGYNTPMLAAIGEGNIQSIKLLIEQDGFNPTREYRGRTYEDISRERKGDEWELESRLLRKAYEAYNQRHNKQSSGRKGRDTERRRARDSSSPFSRRTKSPARIQADGQVRKDVKASSAKHLDIRDSNHGDHTIAVSSDLDRRTPQPKGHKTRRSRSDALNPQSEEEVRKKRRLISRKEHMKTSNTPKHETSDGEVRSTNEHEKEKAASRRRRSSLTGTTPNALDLARAKKRSRRALSESSPEESRSIKKRMSSQYNPQATSKEAKVLPEVAILSQKSQADPILRTSTPESFAESETIDNSHAFEAAAQLRKEAEEKTEHDRLMKIKRDQEAADKRQKEAAEKLALEQEAERLKAEQEARQRAEEEERLAHERKLAEEAAAAAAAAIAKKKAEDELALALARKKEEEERQERLRREAAEEKQRRAEERRQRLLRENEQRRMEALPLLLCRSAQLLDGNEAEATRVGFLSQFLPLFTVKTRQIDADCGAEVADEEWFPGFQAAPLLAAKNLGLEHFTHWEKRGVNERERRCLWKVARTMLVQGGVGDRVGTEGGMSMEEALRLDRDTQPKFEAMQPLVWVKLSDFRERLPLHPYLHGMAIKTQQIGLHAPKAPEPPTTTPPVALSPNGVYGPGNVNVNGVLPNGIGGVNGYHL